MALHVIDIGPPGPLIQVGVRVGAAWENAGRGGAPRSYTALIDTGASITAISPKVVNEVQPQPGSHATLRRIATAPLALNMHYVRVKSEDHLTPGRWFDLEAVETTPVTPGVDILIGQDLLLMLTLLYNGPLGKLVVMY
jgi:predicted aspartyl protease